MTQLPWGHPPPPRIRPEHPKASCAASITDSSSTRCRGEGLTREHDGGRAPSPGGVVCARPWETMIIREIYISERAGGSYREIKKVFVSR